MKLRRRKVPSIKGRPYEKVLIDGQLYSLALVSWAHGGVVMMEFFPEPDFTDRRRVHA